MVNRDASSLEQGIAKSSPSLSMIITGEAIAGRPIAAVKMIEKLSLIGLPITVLAVVPGFWGLRPSRRLDEPPSRGCEGCVTPSGRST
jgi:hypothetical protein